MASPALHVSQRSQPVALNLPALTLLLVVLGLSWLVAVWLPLGCSIVAVFLFAGPHNWLEARYMLARLPARWGPLWNYFAVGLGGTLLLSAAYVLMPWAAVRGVDSAAHWLTLVALWNSFFLAWIAVLAVMRSRQNPRRDWLWVVPLTCVLIGLTWIWPIWLSLALVYVHPLLALWVLDRELKRMKSSWRGAYHVSLFFFPVALAALWLLLANAPHLPGDDLLSLRIAEHAGGGVLPQISTHLLVATHVFLELLHYGVWIVAIPLVSIRSLPWRVENTPLARRSALAQQLVWATVIVGGLVVVVLWGGFLADYPLTRHLYFTLAVWHVLAEIPFLLRLL